MLSQANHSFIPVTAPAPVRLKCANLGAAPSLGEPSSLFAEGFSTDMHIIADFHAQRALAAVEALRGDQS